MSDEPSDASGAGAESSGPPFANVTGRLGLGPHDEALALVWPETLRVIEASGYTLVRDQRARRGASAVVLRAVERASKSAVALKVIIDPKSSRSMQLFHRECALLASPDLPAAVVRYRGVIAADQGAKHQPVLVLEYIDGRSLREYLRETALTLEQRLQLCRRLLRALAALHAAGWFWRDASLNNVLITRGGAIRFVDFGSGKHIAGTHVSVTSIDEVGVGTEGQMPWDVLSGQRKAEVRDDVRAAAAACYVVLGGDSVDRKDSGASKAVRRSRRDLLADLRRRSVPADFSELLVDTLITAEDTGDEGAPESDEVADRFDAWFETRRRSQHRRRQLLSAVIALLIVGGLAAFGWHRYQSEVARRHLATSQVLATELAARPNLAHPALRPALARVDELQQVWKAAQGNDTGNTADRALGDLVAAQRAALATSHDLEAAEPLRASLATILARTPWESSCKAIDARVASATQRFEALGAALDRGEVHDARRGLSAFVEEVARLGADNVAAQQAEQAHSDYVRVAENVSPRIQGLQDFVVILGRAEEAQRLLDAGRFDDSNGPGAATEYTQARVALESLETPEERRQRALRDEVRVGKLEERIVGLERNAAESAARLESLQGLLARTESERNAAASARDTLQSELSAKEAALREAKAGLDLATRQRDVASTARDTAQSGVARLQGELDLARRALSEAEAELGKLRPELEAAKAVVAAMPKSADRASMKHGESFVNDIGLTMIAIAPGTFRMGSPANEVGRYSDEHLHTVTLTRPFRIGRTEVTQEQWFDVMGTRPWRGEDYVIEGDDVAASYITWTDATEFCRRLTERERRAGRLEAGMEYRLPTEAEWEYAARAGTSTRFSFGDDDRELAKYAVYDGSKSGSYAHAVASKRPNAWGLFDMHGNVREWCIDAVENLSELESDADLDGARDPRGRSGAQRVFRGGSWIFSAASCRSAIRLASGPGCSGRHLGFRPVLAASSDVE